MQILHNQTPALLQGILLFWFGAVYEIQLASFSLDETVPKDALHACLSTSGASVYEFWVWHVQSGHTRTTEYLQV